MLCITHFRGNATIYSKRLIDLIGGLEIQHMDVLLKDWSFVSILQKTDAFQEGVSPPAYDYENIMLRYEIEAYLTMARDYEIDGHDALAGECHLFAEKAERSLPALSV